ncbi:alpha/beta hydrolase fold domain-containing protein [Aeromicrobium sp. Sec7.5]|uniref:alpha/beta hydrolase fold domain-containing protein n=1 Tax=Aeromicrobium sp. Sec7.5 TaxID=3121276 RepID=UPI002FE4880D
MRTARRFLGRTAALATRLLLRIGPHRRVLPHVAPDLRVPSLALPLSVRSSLHLAVLRRAMTPGSTVEPGVEVTEIHLDHGRVLVHRPAGGAPAAGALLWFHGGGYVAGRPENDQHTCSWLASRLGVVVVAAEYRLAPEDPFPAALDDAVAALDWLHDHAEQLGVDPARVAVGGASAGGGLAAALAQRALDEGRTPIAFQLLVYPMLDDRTVRRPVSRRPHLVWNPRSNRFGWTGYLGHPAGRDAAPEYAAAARRADLSGLPPAWIGVGDIDLFHDEDVEYARRLTAAGVRCTLHVEPGMFHGADSGFGDGAETTRRFRRALLAAARAAFTEPV